MAFTPEQNDFILDAVSGQSSRGRVIGDKEGLEIMAAMIPLFRKPSDMQIVNDYSAPAPSILSCTFNVWVNNGALGPDEPFQFAPDAKFTLTLSGGTAPTIDGVAGPLEFTPLGEKVQVTIADTATGTVNVTWDFTAPTGWTSSGSFAVVFS